MRSHYVDFVSRVPREQVNPSEDFLLSLCKDKMISNNAGVPVFHTKISARSAAFTEVIGLSGDDDSNLAILENMYKNINPDDFIVMKVSLGKNENIKMYATYTVHKNNANKAMMMYRNFFISDHEFDESDILSMDYSLFDGRKVIVDPRPGERISYLLGIDYYGEAKMSLLRMGMEIMRSDKGGLGLHAGSKTYRLGDNEIGMLIFGLSGTGKTTLTTNTDGPFDDVYVLQDDINFIDADGNSYGTENGFYVKTDNSPEHKEITEAVLNPRSIIENVYIDEQGDIQWKNFSITHNGRAIVERKSLRGTADFIDLSNLKYILFNTRRADLPPIGRLRNANQAAAYYGLGESIITSAEDQARAGESKRVVGFDPFILGDEAKNINRMNEILDKRPDVTCFVVNTGYVGDEKNDITVNMTLSSIIDAITEKIEWVYDEDLGYEIPKKMDSYNFESFNPRNVLGEEKFKSGMKQLREERRKHLEKYPGVKSSIIQSI